ncbi:hypothetical protein MCEMSEM23_00882 [Rhabdaerophilaceae bacterium]
MNRSRAGLPYTAPVLVQSLKGETRLSLRPDEVTRAEIARFCSLHALDNFEADLVLTPRADGSVVVTGHVHANTQPICIVSLEPFHDEVSEDIEATYVTPDFLADLLAKEVEDNPDAASAGTPDLPDPIIDGQIDPAALAVEFLILGLDPYPRKPDADFPDLRVGEEAISPFAALKALKSEPKKP